MFQTNKGKAFLNTLVLNLLEEGKKKLYYIFLKRKASVPERVNHSMKILFKYFTKENARRYIDALPDCVDKYNNFFREVLR